MDESRLSEIEHRAAKARHLVGGLASGREKWTMCVPVQMETDTDMVLSWPLDQVPDLIAALRADRRRMREVLIESSLLQILVEDVRGLLAADNANVRQRYMDILRLELEGLDAKQQNAVPDTDEDDLPMEVDHEEDN